MPGRGLRNSILIGLLLVGSTTIVFVLGLSACAPRVVIKVAAGDEPDAVYFVRTERRLVALTIDDSPASGETELILDTLANHGAHATFFVIGSQVEGNEALLERITGEGHELGNHSLYAETSIDIDDEVLAQQIAQTNQLLEPYGSIRWFRPGKGIYDEEMLALAKSLGLGLALGDVYPFDTLIPSAAIQAWWIVENVKPGSIIVLHDAEARGLRAARTLDRALPKLRELGYQVVTLSELVAHGDTQRTAE